MGDSDNDYYTRRKRSDKFRGERSSERENYLYERRDDRPERNLFRGGRSRPDYTAGGRVSGRYLPLKRMRPDWGGVYAWGPDHYPMHGFAPHLRVAAAASEIQSNNDLQTQPPLLTLKQYLNTQDDSISDFEVLNKYREYKLDFKRQQLKEFFVTHKDEEWFKDKYHPEESLKRKEQQLGFLNRRVEVFTELLDLGVVTTVTVDANQEESLLRLLDTVVIKLEGGTEEDLKTLDEKPQEQNPEIKNRKAYDDDIIEIKFKKEKEESKKTEVEWDMKADKRSVIAISKPPKASGESDWDESETEEKFEEKEATAIPETNEPPEKNETELIMNENKEKDVDVVESGEKKSDENNDENKVEKPQEITDLTIVEEDKTKLPDEESLKEIQIAQRHLHRTSSIFLRNMAPSITKAEIEAICKGYDGFLRVAIADPLVERRWFRRAWVTFKRDVNIKQICWTLNNKRLRDYEMGPIVNRDLSRRVRPVNGVTAHKNVVHSDIKLCAKIILNLDEKFSVWLNKFDAIEPPVSSNTNGESAAENDFTTFGFKSNNPVLQNIADYLIEEASAEEEELLGLTFGGGNIDNKDVTDGDQLKRDQQLISVLDKLILYLRVVHSVDFYNHCEYPYEDEMPNRCGIIHARGPAPQNKVTQSDVQEYIKNFKSKMSSFLEKSTQISEEEMENLGAKDPGVEVEKFIQANTKILAKDKWLCSLSGKKFKGPEFIRKHIYNKYTEKVQEIRKQVEYFNNYLKDPKRPQLPEHPCNSKRQYAGDVPPHAEFKPIYAAPYFVYAQPMVAQPKRGFDGRRRYGSDYRSVTDYRDLDAPYESVDIL